MWTTITLWNPKAKEVTVIHIHGTQEAIKEIKKIIELNIKLHEKMEERVKE